MRFVRLKTVIKKVCDTEITELNEIKPIVESIHKKELTCSLRIGKGPLFESVRITETEEKGFKFSIIKNRSVLRQFATYEEIDYLEVSTESEILVNKPKTSRWDLLLDDE